jgi:citrate lyase subunit beta/citryl-CoA lyase
MRSLLFVPGDNERKQAKGLECGADVLILDLEDSVAPSAKAAARATTAAFLSDCARRPGAPLLIVRVNPLTSGETEADLDAIVAKAPYAIMLPKSLDAASVQQLSTKIAVREAVAGLPDGAIRILPIATETAAAVFGLASYRGASARLAGLTWGAEDLSANLGAEGNRLPDGAYASPFRLARDLTLMAAVAAELSPIDTVFTNFRDLEGLRAESIAARRDGFVAKMAIHPAQVPVINEVFTPSPEAVARAQAVIAAFDAAPGAGVVGLEGEMLDLPHRLRAETVLARAGARRL